MHLQGLLVEDQQQDTLVYAGEATVRITDWFFFKNNIDLKYIGLDNALVNMYRKDSVWNYQFLIDYFSSPSSSDQKTGGAQLNLHKVELKNILFVQKDDWVGKSMTVALSSFDLDARNVNMANKTIDITSLKVVNPYVSLSNYAGTRPADYKKPAVAEATKDPTIDSLLKWNAAGWVINANSLTIQNGTFKNDRQTIDPAYPYFDGRHIEFSMINSQFHSIKWEKDTIRAQLSLQAKERSGFTVKNMEASVKVTPQEMAFANLEIKTNNSIIRDYFRMSYDDFDDMNDFIHAVRMQGRFKDTHIDSDDIAFFAPALEDWNKNIELTGVVRGYVDDLVGENLVVQAGKNTLLNGHISMTGLPDINKTFIDFTANDFKTNYADAVTLIPAIRQVTVPDLRKLQYLHFKGNFTGFIRDFVTFGTIQTNLGAITTDLNMKLPANLPPVYSGTLSTPSFRLGQFINDSSLGIVSVTGTLKGSGINFKERNTSIDGKINFVDYKDYRYHNISLNGQLDKKQFNGTASINDPEAELTLNGLIDFNTEKPAFNLLADVKKVNLQQLKLVPNDIAFSGKLNLNFTGDNIDNFLGKASISEATLLHNGEQLPFDTLVLLSSYDNNEKTISASANEFSAVVKGQFNIRDLPDAFRLFLNKYYPAYIKPPVTTPNNESLSFDITTNYVESYLRLIDSTVTGFNNSHIRGKLNTSRNEFTLEADVPQFNYQQYNFDNVNVLANGTKDSLSVIGNVSNINISDSLNIPLAVFRVNAHNDSSHVKIYTGANQAINQANINALVLTYQNGVKIEVEPSSFSISGKMWTIGENGSLEFRANVPARGQLVLKESNQEIRLKTRPSETGDWNDLIVELHKVNLGDFSPFLMPKNRLEGLLSGTIVAEDPFNNLYATGDDVLIEALRLDNDSIGNIQTNLVYEGNIKNLRGEGATLNEQNKLAYNFNLFFGDELQKEYNSISLEAKTYSLSILERFLGSLFSNITGFVTGNFKLEGPLDQLQITGKGNLQQAGLKVNFTNCYYKIQDTPIELTPSLINLDGIVLTDPETGNPVYLTGDIQHQGFKNMFFDLTVATRKPNTLDAGNNRPILLLNTSFADNQQFYGRVKGTGSFSLTGPESELYMKIDAIASQTDSSIVTIPSSTSRESGIADFLVEKKYGREMIDSTAINKQSNIIYDVDVTANPMVTVQVILDDLTGDEIKGRGTGTLNILSGTNEKLSMRGRFDIEEGNYLFTFQSFFKKPFEIRKGVENYIAWSGDPMAANIKFEAQYTAENVSFAPLANSLTFDQTYSRLREDVYVIVDLTGDLFKPNFKFRLDFPPNSQASRDFAVASSIEQLSKNENDLLQQAAFLVTMNSFIPLETSANANTGFSTAINELTYNTISSISGLFFNEVNQKINSELSKILKTDNISVNFSGSVYNRNLLNQQASGNFNINQSNFNVNVPISLFDDRFVVTLGSTLDVPLQSTIQQNVQFLPDVTAEWLINESGTIRASFFYRQNIDYLTTNTSGAGRTKRSGASIAYRKEFDTLEDFLASKKKKAAKQNRALQQNQLPVTDSTELKKNP